MEAIGAQISVAALTHDLVVRRSLVTLVWAADPDKRVTLPVPYGCDLDRIVVEAERALRTFSAEIGAVTVRLSDGG